MSKMFFMLSVKRGYSFDPIEVSSGTLKYTATLAPSNNVGKIIQYSVSYKPSSKLLRDINDFKRSQAWRYNSRSCNELVNEYPGVKRELSQEEFKEALNEEDLGESEILQIRKTVETLYLNIANSNNSKIVIQTIDTADAVDYLLSKIGNYYITDHFVPLRINQSTFTTANIINANPTQLKDRNSKLKLFKQLINESLAPSVKNAAKSM